ncbi:hypothetical protein VTO73DRAFT_11847 [Trametes versicolor]
MPLVLELQCDIPYEFYPGRCDGFEEYMTLKEQICYDYRHPPDFKRLYAEGQCSVRENFPGRLKYGLRVDDGPLMLEHCLRTISVCNPLITTDDWYNPLSVSKRLAGVYSQADEERANFRLPEIRDLTSRLRLQGLACYAYLNFYACWVDKKRTMSCKSLVPVDGRSTMYDACSAANVCVGLGFVPPVALRIAGWVATTKARFGVDYLSRLQLKEDAWLRKVAKAPYLYREPCQRQHWIIHREFCKSDTTNDFTDIVADDGNPDWVDIDDFNIHIDEKPPWKREWPLFSDYEGLEIFIDIRNDSPFRKGEIVRLKTRTLSPECLKAYRSVWAPVRNSAKSKMRKHIEKLMSEPPANMGFPQRDTWEP